MLESESKINRKLADKQKKLACSHLKVVEVAVNIAGMTEPEFEEDMFVRAAALEAQAIEVFKPPRRAPCCDLR
jgi:hypothetical protein